MCLVIVDMSHVAIIESSVAINDHELIELMSLSDCDLCTIVICMRVI
jgi:hypothetical protein